MKPPVKILLVALFMKMFVQISMKSEEDNSQSSESNEDQGFEDESQGSMDHGDDADAPYILSEHDMVPFNTLETENNPDVQNIILNIHNYARMNVDPPSSDMAKLVWNDQLRIDAKEWAEKCHLNHSTNDDRTRIDSMQGENMALSDTPVSWNACINSWMREKNYFNYGNMSKYETNHYAQMIASKTQQVGCAVAKCDNGTSQKYVCMCRYNPMGNEIETMNTPYQVGTPCSQCNKCDPDTKLCYGDCPYRDAFKGCERGKSRCGETEVNNNCSATCRCPVVGT